MIVTCALDHRHDIGDVPTDQGAVRWECPTCQSVDVVPGTYPQPLPEGDAVALEGSVQVADSDAGQGTSTTG